MTTPITGKPWFDEVKNRIVVCAENLATIQVWFPEGEYSAEASSGNDPVDVVSSPPDNTASSLKRSFLTVCRERAVSDMTRWNDLVARLVKDEKVDGDPSVSVAELAEFLSKGKEEK